MENHSAKPVTLYVSVQDQIPNHPNLMKLKPIEFRPSEAEKSKKINRKEHQEDKNWTGQQFGIPLGPRLDKQVVTVISETRNDRDFPSP
jgi:hypothetical protein